MKKNILIAIVIVLSVLLVGLILKLKVFSGTSFAALRVNSEPQATVFIDGTQVGITPFFDDKIKSGEHTVKLVPGSAEIEMGVLEKKVSLVSTAMTIIDYTFKEKQSETFGQILFFEKIASRDKAALSVVSIPDQAVVKVNNDPKGFTPILLDNLDPGSYQIFVSSPGYEEKSLPSVNLIAGYKIKVEVKLAQKMEGIEESTSSGESLGVGDSFPEEITPTPSQATKNTTPTPTEKIAKLTPTPIPESDSSDTVEKPYVLVKQNDIGFLRVRSTSSTSGEELGKAEIGDKLPYLGAQENGWYKVSFKNEEGWVSGTYVELVK